MKRSVALIGLACCATLADSDGGDANPATALAGPFRLLATGELGEGRVAPWVLRDTLGGARDLAVLDVDGDPTTPQVHGYVARRAEGDDELDSPTRELGRAYAEDGRSFGRDFETVLTASEPWEGGVLEAPCPVRVPERNETSLYYAAAEGVGLARSVDEGPFIRTGQGPVLGVSTSGWDEGLVPRSPSVVRDDDGRYFMFFEADGVLGEARSRDGEHWERESSPALALALGSETTSLGGPSAVFSRSATGRKVLWLYFVSSGADGARRVHAAARVGEGPFVRSEIPMLAPEAVDELSEPSIVRFDGFTLLYATALDKGSLSSVGAVAPATVLLSAPSRP